MGVNRDNKYKDKKGSSCKMCKPHKNGWVRSTKEKHRNNMISNNNLPEVTECPLCGATETKNCKCDFSDFFDDDLK